MRVEIAGAEQTKEPLARLMQLYLHDLSEFDGAEVAEDARYACPYFELYWQERERHPFLIRADGKVAGFALVREEAPGVHQMAEFFVLRTYRRAGVGTAAARLLFDRFPGTWRVAQLDANTPAQSFWRRTIDVHTNGRFRELRSTQPVGPLQEFSA